MYLYRTKFKKEILTEFLPPSRPVKQNKVLIICTGAPGLPDNQERVEFFSKKGYWTFSFRYRGSWESSGKFLAVSPAQDVLDIIDEIPKGFTEAWGGKKFRFTPDKIYVLGSSFGGAAAILSSLSEKVDKAIAISPVIDWRKMGPEEPYPKMIKFFDQGFGEGYRFAKNGWDKLKSGKFFNPIQHVEKIDPNKILLIHAKDDQTCLYKTTKTFCEKSHAQLVTLHKGGHLSSSIVLKPRLYKLMQKFFSH